MTLCLACVAASSSSPWYEIPGGYFAGKNRLISGKLFDSLLVYGQALELSL
jgi:hypothetical protein